MPPWSSAGRLWTQALAIFLSSCSVRSRDDRARCPRPLPHRLPNVCVFEYSIIPSEVLCASIGHLRQLSIETHQCCRHWILRESASADRNVW